MIRPVMDGSFEAEYTIFNTSISIYIPFPGKYRRIFGFNSVYQRLSKIVKAERSGKMKTKFSILTLPRRILSYEKIVKAERSGKMKTKFSILTLLRRLLSYQKIVKAERKTEEENKVVDRAHTDTPKEQTRPIHFCTFFLYFRRVYIYQLLNIHKCFISLFPENSTLSFDFLYKCIKDGFFVILVFSNL